MSLQDRYREADDSDPPFDAREKARVKTDWKTLSIMVVGAFMAGTFYMSQRSTNQALEASTAALTANQVSISNQLMAQHDSIRDVQASVHLFDAKLDYLVGGRRGPAPASIIPPP